MINFKKALAGAALLAAAVSFASADDKITVNATAINDVNAAPASMSDASTAGRFGTDVDDYMGVNDWSNVEFDKWFGFVGYNFDGNKFNMGYATKLKDNYLGFYFGGYGADFTMKSRFSSDTDAVPNSYTYQATSTEQYAFALLFGTAKGIGIKASVYYAPTQDNGNDSNYNKPDTSKDAYTSLDVWELYADLQVGLGDEKATHFEIGLDSNVAKASSNQGYTDASWYDLYLRGGLTLKEWDLDLDTRWRITPLVRKEGKDYKEWQYGETNNLIQFTAARAFDYEATEKLALSAKFAFPLSFGITADYDASKTDTTSSGDWTYNTARTHNIDIVLTPTLDLGAKYKVLPNKFDFNFGTSLELGNIGWNIIATGSRKSDSASYDDTVTDVTFGWDHRTMDITWVSGFTVHFSEKVTLDAEYQIMRRVLNGFSSNVDTFNGRGVNETVGKVFFSDAVNLLLSVKF